MASIKVSDLQATTSTAADSFLYVADTTNGGVDFDSKKITVANFLNAYATEAFVSTQISDLINGAPEALNTLKEISDVIGDSNDVVGNLISMIDANETHVDNVATLTGVAKDSADMGSFSGTTITDASTIKSALQQLETALETKGDNVDLSGVISNTGDLLTLSGLPGGSVTLGVFDGDTLTDESTLKVVLQDAEDAIEANASAIATEASNRAAAITALTDGAVASNTAAINQEVTDRAAAITALTNGAVADNAADIVTNAAAITSLTNGAVATNAAAIAQEVTDRQAAVSAEATARADADALLMPKAGGTFTGAISGPAPTANTHLVTKLYADQLVANVDLSQVETNRVDIAAETSARTSADTALSGRLDVLEADPTTATALQAEASTRASADTALSNRVTSLEADPTTQTLLNAETTARTSADTALSNRLDTLEADPTTQTLLDAETAARIAGDALLLPLAGGTMSGDLNVGTSVSGGTWDSSTLRGATTLSNNDKTFNTSSDPAGREGALGGFTLPETGKFYWEIKKSGDLDVGVGLFPDADNFASSTWIGSQNGHYGIRVTMSGSQIYNGTTSYSQLSSSNLMSTSVDTTIGIALDRDAGELKFFRGGVESSQYAFGIPSTHQLFGVIMGTNNSQDASVTIRTDSADWEYAAPAGFEALPAGGSGGATTIAVDGTATFSGNVTADAAPTAAGHLVNKLYADNLVAGVDLSGIATNAAAIEALTNGAPDLLNTLNEIANAIGDDENFATTITNQISTESTTRAAADTALSGRLDVLEADPTTATALASEASTRATADTALSGRLDVLEADPTTQTLLTAETTARTAADSALSGRLDTLEADPTTQTLLTAEATTRAAADTALSGRLDTLEADPTTATAVTNAIAVETAARQAADALLLPLAGGTLTGDLNVGAGGGAGNVVTINNSYADKEVTYTGGNAITQITVVRADNPAASASAAYIVVDGVQITDSTGWTVTSDNGWYNGRDDSLLFSGGTDPNNITNATQATTNGGGTITIIPPAPLTGDISLYSHSGAMTFNFHEEAGVSTTIAADGTASFGANVTAAAVPTADAHLVNKLYADQLVANVDLSQVETNRLDILQEIADRAAAITALTNGQVATNATNISANATAISQEVTDRAAAITALTNGQVATNASGIATNATAITNLTNGAVADNAAAITALTNGAVASNTAAITQEVTDRQAAIAALTNGAVADNAAAITALTNGAVADNAAAVVQEAADRAAADALKVDKQSLVNEHLLGQTSAQSAPVDAQGNSNYLFLVVDKATGALKSIDKTFLEAE